MPSRTVLFGMAYNERGVTIRAHHPCFDPPQQRTKVLRVPEWGVDFSIWDIITVVVSVPVVMTDLVLPLP
jgi:hypothetical protein